MRKLTLILIFSLMTILLCDAQIVMTGNNDLEKDSVLNEFSNGPYFTLYKDNYFIGGTSIGPKPTKENSNIKFQVSIAQRLTRTTLPFNSYLFLFYNQLCIWNIFENSMPMRDFNFNPGIGISKLLIVKNRVVGKVSFLIEHESNGKDGDASRSWNRITFGSSIYIDPRIMIHGKIWIPIIDGQNNKDILKYYGTYQVGMSVLSSNKRLGVSTILRKRQGFNLNYNAIVEINFRLFPRENQFLFIQYFNGYGENLLDYNKFKSELRVGLVIKPRLFSDY